MTPVGYRTTYWSPGPGGYRFTDYVRVGALPQAILAVGTTLGIPVVFGLGL